jgi:hypothetical protein
MTPREFVSGCEASCASLALHFANAPDEVFERGLEAFTTNVRGKLTERFGAWVSPAVIAGTVETMRAEVQRRRREIEAGGCGRG